MGAQTRGEFLRKGSLFLFVLTYTVVQMFTAKNALTLKLKKEISQCTDFLTCFDEKGNIFRHIFTKDERFVLHIAPLTETELLLIIYRGCSKSPYK